jgi:hypothetical protein
VAGPGRSRWEVHLGARRNLLVPIVAHGVSNSLAFVLIYVGRYPGV